MLNKSYPPPASTKIIDDTGNGVTSLNNHQHEPQYNPTKAVGLKVEDNAMVNDDSYAVATIDNIKESNR